MRTREILVASTKTQKQYKVLTNAATLGEFKQAIDANEDVFVRMNGQWVRNDEPIDYTNLSFTEGITRTRLLDDASPLPESVSFRGEQKNPVMLLTNTEKKIDSGCDRKGAYEIIKERNLADAIKEEFGINYTHISTADLWEFINNIDEEEDEEVFEDTPKISDEATALYAHIKLLAQEEVLSVEDLHAIAEMTEELANRINETTGDDFAAEGGNVSSDDLNNMLNSITQ